MTKLEFLAAFRAACVNLREDVVEAAVADYERQFTDHLLAGGNEADIVGRWGSPATAARKLRLSTFNGNLAQAVSAEKVARVGVSGLGLAAMDLLLVGPAIIYTFVLGLFYAVSLAIYLSGIFVSAASLAQVNYIDLPTEYLTGAFNFDGRDSLKFANVEIVPDEIADVDAAATPTPGAGNDLLLHSLHHKNFHIATKINQQTIWKGLGTTVAGMVLLILCLLATRLSFRAVRRFAAWHFSVLKNA